MNSLVTISEVVSDALETPVDELPPLSGVIDPDALDRLVSSTASTRPTGVTVVFEYAGLKVVVHSDSRVYATPIDDESKPTLNRRSFGT